MAANKKNTRKGKGKATVKDTRDLNTCPICLQWFDEVHYDMGDWIEMPLQTVDSRGLH